MKFVSPSFSSIFLLLAVLSPALPAQQSGDEETSRGAFLITRTKPAGGSAGTKAPPAGNHNKPPVTGKPAKTPAPVPAVGLGYTLYQKDADGNPVRVEASREFHAGDAVRLMIEANTDGFLYVFHTENGNNPQMIFPDARLNGGDNHIRAHVPYEVPSRQETDPRFRWFYFDQNAATERLYLVVTREPLPGVPSGGALVTHCRNTPKDCPWRPESALWGQLASNVGTASRLSRNRDAGQRQTETESEAVNRGLGLPPDAPAPSVVGMNTSGGAKRLVMTIDLVHK
ncbi:MAG TPA: DUF4384 domain-containing protein [Blastocatellia bacterium]|nr:DUF4384 domain-containing protein [Blastocatellia bacterium]